MYKHIVIPTDGSTQSARAGAAGVEFARAIGARITALYAMPAPTPVVYENIIPVRYLGPDEHAALIERSARHYLGAIEEAARVAGVPCESVSITSDFPADTIVATAKRRKCDLIFMASHGRRGISALLLGSETQKVLAHSKLPVFVYR
jgi:nucleotide-binding universal stress UspA family protein